MVDRSMPALLRSMRKDITALKRRIARGTFSLPERLSLAGMDLDDWNAASAVGFYRSDSAALNAPPGSGPVAGYTSLSLDSAVPVLFQDVRRGDESSTLWSRHQDASGVWSAWLPAYAGDTGWVDLAANFLSGFSGTMQGRVIGKVAEVSGEVTGAVPSVGSVTAFASAPPAAFLPLSNRWGTAYQSGYVGGVTVRPSSAMAVANRTGVSWSSFQFSLTYLVD